MNKIFAFLVSLAILLASCVPIQQTEVPAPELDPFNIPWDDRSIFKPGLVESQQPILEELEDASVYHIELNIAKDLYHVSGRQEVQYTNTETVPLDQVHLRLFPNLLGGEMEVSNLKVNDEDISPTLEMNDSLLIAPLTAALEPGDSVVIEMDFEVTVPQKVELNYGVLAYYEDVLALAHAYPMIAVYNDEGWNAEIPVQQGDIAFADTSFYVVRITAPQEVTLAPSGTVIERAEDGTTQTLLVASGPARDFFLAASPNYEEVSQTLGEITVRSFAPQDSAEAAKAALDIAIDSLELFNSKYPSYPYTELDIVATPTLAGGIEYPGNIVVTSQLYGSEVNNPGARQYLEGVVAHEVAHQWFYNFVGDDQLDDPWLDEALAQYLTYEYFTSQYGSGGEEGFRASLEERWARVNFAEIPIGMPVAAYDETEYGAIVYGRGPLFFIALRDEIGEEVFNAFLKDYATRLSWEIATPEFLQSLVEEHCACDLDSMFDEWVYP